MELKQALGNTWYLEDWQLIPLYRTDETTASCWTPGLLPAPGHRGHPGRRRAHPIGILGSHAHNDHSSNHHYFQQRYHIPVALSLGEAGLCCSMESLKSHFYMNSMGEFSSNQQFNHMVVRTDQDHPAGGGKNQLLRGGISDCPHPGPLSGPHRRHHPGRGVLSGGCPADGQ